MSHPSPILPTARPSGLSILAFGTASFTAVVIGIGLGAGAIAIYKERADYRVAQIAALEQLERQAELSQRAAQLKRNTDAPIWINTASYDPTVTYQLSGISKTEVPVIVGYEIDTAVCVGVLGPEGFIQNPDHRLCLGY